MRIEGPDFMMMGHLHWILPMQESSSHRKPIKHFKRLLRDAIFAVVSAFSRRSNTIEISASPPIAGVSIENEAIIRDAYGSLRAGNPNRTWRVLQGWLKSRGDQSEDYARLSSRVAQWGDARLMTHLIDHRVSRLLALKRTDEVLDLVAHRLAVDPRFRPRSAADTLNLAQLATRRGDLPRVSQVLLSDFDSRFKGDPRVTVAESLRRFLNSRASRIVKTA
jgi:hypothetical protein